MELFAAIRKDQRDEDLSIRELAERHHVHRRTVRAALASAVPPERKVPARTARVLEPFKPVIDAMLRVDLDAPRKQRHTARRVLARLVDEHDADGLSYSTVRDYVAKRRPEIVGGGGPVDRAGVRPAGPRDGCRGRGRLRRLVGAAARGEDENASVHVPAVGLGPVGASGVRHPRRRRRSWKAMSTRSTGWVGCRGGTSATTT